MLVQVPYWHFGAASRCSFLPCTSGALQQQPRSQHSQSHILFPIFTYGYFLEQQMNHFLQLMSLIFSAETPHMHIK